MTTRLATVAAGLIATLALAGCTGAAGAPSASPTPAAPSPSATAAEPSPSPSVTAPPSAGPLTVEGELTFGSRDFGGVAVGEAPDTFAEELGLNQQACGDVNFPSVIPTDLSRDNPASNWEVFLMVNWDQDGVEWLDWDVQAFLLVAPYGVPSEPTGPVGPRGLRLGTSEATIEAMFPTEAAASTTRDTYFQGAPTRDDGTPIPVTERVFTIADVDGGPMIITTLDGAVATMMWGEAAYVSVDKGFLVCNA